MCSVTGCHKSSRYQYNNCLYCFKHFIKLPNASRNRYESRLFYRTIDLCDKCNISATHIYDYYYLCKKHYDEIKK